MQRDANAEFERQYRALRSSGGSSVRPLPPGEGSEAGDRFGIVPLSDWSSITLTGGDRHNFLHNFSTNDIKRLRPGEACEAFFLDVKGKILGHGFVSCRENEIVIFGEPGQAPPLLAHLERYVIREDIRVRDTTTERSYVLVAGGPAARAVLARLENAGGRTWTAIPSALVGSPVERVLETLAGDREPLIAALEAAGGVTAIAAFDAARVEAGVPWFGVDYDNANLPQEVGRSQQALSFTKGCYLGQETVARIDALGHVNQRIVGVRFEGTQLPPVGSELARRSNVVGRVTSAAFSPRLAAPLALAMLRNEATAAGTRLESSVGACEVTALPLPG